jgi:Fe-S cluster assembly scaffold protein SufB
MCKLLRTVDRAEKAKDKKAAIGADIDLSQYTTENADEHEDIESLQDLRKKDQKVINKVGMEPDETGRSASFLQYDQSKVFVNNMFPDVEIMGTGQALEKYDWLKDYMWKAVQVDADKYTANTELGTTGGYFIRSKPNTKQIMPVQACMFIGDPYVQQTAHNIIVAEENSELHIITGCSTAEDVQNAVHIGVSEFYIKKGAKVTFTMVHNWDKEVEVRPRTSAILEDDSTFISNYILTDPVDDIQMYPTAYCNGKNSNALFQSILAGKGDSHIDQGARLVLNGEGAKGESITRAISNDQSEIYTRGDLQGNTVGVKGHLECMGLVLSDESSIHSIPELTGSHTDLDLSHEAAVGKIAENEIQYLMARGLTEDEATSMIVHGFLDMDITGLPDELAAETQKMIDMSLDGM